jgi:hypothetical protein
LYGQLNGWNGRKKDISISFWGEIRPALDLDNNED